MFINEQKINFVKCWLSSIDRPFIRKDKNIIPESIQVLNEWSK